MRVVPRQKRVVEKRVVEFGWNFAGVFYTKSYNIVRNFSLKEWKWRPLWIFQVFCFSLRFWLVCLILMYQAPNVPKKYPKIYFQCKISSSIECRWQNWPEYRGKARKLEEPLYFWKIHNPKTPFLNSLKLGREVGNQMKNFPEW